MIKRIKRMKCLTAYPIFPLRNYNKDIKDYDYFYPHTFSNYILTLKSDTYKKLLKNLGKELFVLSAALKSNGFIFLGDEKLAWRFREGKYKNFKKGMAYFENEGVKKTFTGGLIAGGDDMIQFIKHLANLVAVNGLIQYVHFTYESQNIMGSICKYGNVHISTINKEGDDLFKNAILSTKFDFLDGKC